MLEYARNVSLLEDASSTEVDPNAATPLLTLAACPIDSRPSGSPRLTGQLKIRVKRDSAAFEAYGRSRIEEPFHCNYELNPAYQQPLERSGLRVTGVSADGGTRIAELPKWFWVGTGFLPQLNSAPGQPHPLIVAFLKAAMSLKRLKGLKAAGDPRPETIENRWDILYRDYPEVYEEFASVPYYGKKWIDVVRQLVDLKGKTVADIGSGSGKSTFELAKYAGQVIGVEPEDAMTAIAVKNARELGLTNVTFKKGSAFELPLDDGSVDVSVSTAAALNDAASVRRIVREAQRITKPGGYVFFPHQAVGWYGGELGPINLRGPKPQHDFVAAILAMLGFEHRDFYSTADYGTVDKAVATYGFIFGRRAIAYLRARQKSTVKFKYRVYYRKVE